MMETGPDKNPGGAAIDYWKKYIAPEMNVELEVVGPFPIMRVTKMLEEDKVDIIPNMTRVPEREAIFIYPETNMSEISSCLVVLNGSPIKRVAKQEDLLNMKIGYIKGGFVPPLLKHEKIIIELTSGTDYRQILLGKLLAKRFVYSGSY